MTRDKNINYLLQYNDKLFKNSFGYQGLILAKYYKPTGSCRSNLLGAK